ncbi:hypothetical protein DMC25_00100 [Caulobacter sp. D4A]|uniref:phospholipase D-like domain-containing protein n=1 Tax=unclassified Caulobacter TaxID=2648921 RepID=UPI000D72CB18|nr:MULTISPECIES: phospholipase D-like domain-containing protein [unclassified Caulobacter]PXA93488.1 hypothetical protein DMC18_08805 [Caulobacter sp. D5]PXA95754.1 hypothetical protein DMC25_00100 [Caulobacter sp. D4A]
MKRQFYLPVFKVGVAYVVKQGRAWTAFEHALLWHLAETHSTLDELRTLSGLPTRLVVGALLELMGAGWVSLTVHGSAVRFAATPVGAQSARKTKLNDNLVPRRRSDTLCLDRLVGSAIDPLDLTLVHRDKIPAGAAILPSRTFTPTVSPTDGIERLFMLEDESFEEWVDHRLNSQNFYALVAVGGDDIEGLPEYAPLALRQAIAEEAERLDTPASAPVALAGAAYRPSRRYQTDVGPDDLIVGTEAHLEILEHVLANARSSVVIHSCFVSGGSVNRLLPALTAAANRGVTIELLWGLRYADATRRSQAGVNAAREAIAKLPDKARRRILFADKETSSHAKVLIADSGPQGRFEGYVGSCNWLSTIDWTELSIRIRDPRVLADLAGMLATLLIPPHGSWGGDVHRLVKLKKRLSGLSPVKGDITLDLLIDREHLALVRHARDDAQTRIVCACDLLGPAGETSVFVPMRVAAQSDLPVELQFNRPTDSVRPDRAIAAQTELANAGIALRDVGPDFHAKYLLWDDKNLCVTSFNWLATTADPWKPKGSEIGILLSGSDLNNALLEQMERQVLKKVASMAG